MPADFLVWSRPWLIAEVGNSDRSRSRRTGEVRNSRSIFFDIRGSSGGRSIVVLLRGVTRWRHGVDLDACEDFVGDDCSKDGGREKHGEIGAVGSDVALDTLGL